MNYNYNYRAIELSIKEEFEKISNDAHLFSLNIPENHFQLKEIMNFFGEVKGKKVLDIGCAKGRFLKHLIKYGAFGYGIDISENLIKEAKKNVPRAKFLQGSATSLPFKNDFFDFVYSIETFEHIPNIEKAISEISRVLKKGGKVIIIDKSLYSLHPIFFLLPTFLIKWFLEKTKRWKIYMKNKISYKERYFTKRDLDKILSKYFSYGYSIKIKSYGIGPKTKMLVSKFSFLKIYFYLVDIIYSLFPFTRFYIVWKWIK